MITTLTTLEDVRTWIETEILPTLGLGFHADTPFEDYIDRNGEQTYSAIDSERLNALMDIAIEICEEAGLDIYEVSMECATWKAQMEALIATSKTTTDPTEKNRYTTGTPSY
jgi:hypothetical protein